MIHLVANNNTISKEEISKALQDWKLPAVENIQPIEGWGLQITFTKTPAKNVINNIADAIEEVCDCKVELEYSVNNMKQVQVEFSQPMRLIAKKLKAESESPLNNVITQEVIKKWGIGSIFQEEDALVIPFEKIPAKDFEKILNYLTKFATKILIPAGVGIKCLSANYENRFPVICVKI